MNRMHASATALRLATFLVAGAMSANLAAAIVAPLADGIVRDGSSTVKNGTPDNILAGSVIQVLNLPTIEDRGIIEFSTSGLATPVASAQLVLQVFSGNGPYPFGIDVFGYVGDGALTLSDWNNGAYITTFQYSGAPKAAADVTSFARGAVTAGSAFIGFNLRMSQPSSAERDGPFLAFGSLEIPQAATLRINEPSLPVPEPDGALLLGAGFAALLGAIRLRSAGRRG